MEWSGPDTRDKRSELLATNFLCYETQEEWRDWLVLGESAPVSTRTEDGSNEIAEVNFKYGGKALSSGLYKEICEGDTFCSSDSIRLTSAR